MTDYAVIALQGEQAWEFLQGYVTCDVMAISSGGGQLAACCNLKGRVISSFYIVNYFNHAFLLHPKETTDITIEHLQKYAVFSQTELVDVSNQWNVYQCMSVSDADAPIRVCLPASSRGIVLSPISSPLSIESASTVDWQLADIKEGVFLVDKIHSGQYLPQMLDYHQLGAISFTKGCYLGQEIVARTQHLGKLKRQLIRAVFLDEPKETVEQQGQWVADVLSCIKDAEAGWQALLVMQKGAELPLGRRVDFQRQEVTS